MASVSCDKEEHIKTLLCSSAFCGSVSLALYVSFGMYKLHSLIDMQSCLFMPFRGPARMLIFSPHW